MSVFDVVSLPFQWGSAIRGKRFFHPDGVFADGFFKRVAPAGQGLPIPSSDVVARVSKATGTPGSLPDFIGLAFRLVTPQPAETPWDILLVTSGSGVLARAVVLRPAFSWNDQTLTTLMPLRYQGNNWWLRARTPANLNGSGLSLDSVRTRLKQDVIEITLDQARGTRHFTPLGHLRLTSALDPARGGDISFDPVVNTASGVSLYPGWLAQLRASSYQRSREGRDQP
ncbi:MAG TPA: phosphodiesterase [Mycobacterium sp.]|jgi:hypothetical protein